MLPLELLKSTARRAMIAWIQGDFTEAATLRTETNELARRLAVLPITEAGRAVSVLQAVYDQPEPWRRLAHDEALAQFLVLSMRGARSDVA